MTENEGVPAREPIPPWDSYMELAEYGPPDHLPVWAESADRKLGRAREHFKTLEFELGWSLPTLVKHHGYRLAHETERGEREHVLRVYDLPEVLPRVSLVFSDFVTNVRAALDYMVYSLTELAFPNGVPDDIAKGSGFPIFRSPHAFKSTAPVKIGNVPRAACTVIKKVQPYQTVPVPYDVDRDTLALMDELANFYKHRRPHIVWYKPSLTIHPHGSHVSETIDYEGPLENGAEVVRVRFTDPQPKGNVFLDASLEHGIEVGGQVTSLHGLGLDLMLCARSVLRALADAVP